MSEVRNIGIIVFDEVLTVEVTGPAEVFAVARDQGALPEARVWLIGVENQPTIRTAEGLTLTVDCTLADAPPLDVLLVPGANEVDALLNHAGLKAFIQRHEAGSWLASICAGAFVLGNAGVLDGKPATTWFGGETSLQTQFPQIQVQFDTPVVTDPRYRVITANGGLVSYRAALVLLARLVSPEAARRVYDSLGIARLGDWHAIVADLN